MNKTSDTPFHRLTAWVTLLALIITSFPARATLSQARGRIIFTQHKTAANRTSESATVTVTDAADATRVDTIASSYGFDAQGRMTQMTDASGHDTNGNQLRMRTTRTLASGVVTCKKAGRFQKCSFVPQHINRFDHFRDRNVQLTSGGSEQFCGAASTFDHPAICRAGVMQSCQSA